jgi:hypothetical protein
MDGLRLPRWLAPLLILLLIAGVVVGNHLLRPAAPGEQTLHCADLAAGCAARLGDRPIRVGMAGERKPFMPFEVWLRIDAADKVQASFTMEGMDMGFNLYTLRRGADSVWRARVTLPVCVSGQREWLMTLDIDGHRLRVPFVTQL